MMLATLIFGALFALITLTRLPLGLVMLFCGAAGITVLHPRGFSAALAISEQQVMNLAMNYQFSVLPLFILMGVFVVKAGLAEDMFEAARRWLGHLPGGVGMATIMACGGFAAMCASSSAAAATIARIALPQMDKAGYDPGFSAGSVAAGGTMGILIPPSGALIIFALLTEQSVGELFIAGIVPGLMQLAIYVGVVAAVARFRPTWAPVGRLYTWVERLGSLSGIWGVVALFLLIMLGLTRGWFTATEAGGIGAGGAFLFLLWRRRFTWAVFAESLAETARLSSMIFVVAAGSLVLNQFINLSGVSGDVIR
jgi:tripartite ATP-independent transporter DctM subunit